MAKTNIRGTQIADATVDLTVDVTGTLPIANGGTNATSAGAALTSLGALPTAGGTMAGLLTLKTGSTTVAPLKMVAGTNLTTPVAGTLEFDGTKLYFSV